MYENICNGNIRKQINVFQKIEENLDKYNKLKTEYENKGDKQTKNAGQCKIQMGRVKSEEEKDAKEIPIVAKSKVRK